MLKLGSKSRNARQKRLPGPAATVAGLPQVHQVDQDVPADYGTPMADALRHMSATLADIAATIGRFEPLSLEIMRAYGLQFMDAHVQLNAALAGIMKAIPDALAAGEIKQRW